MTILGISAFYHDSAAAIVQDGEIIAAAQEERFTRKKHDASFPVNAIKFCLKYAGKDIGKLDAIAFYDKPLLKFERLLETYYGFAPKGLASFVTSMPVWIKEKIFLKRVIHEELEQLDGYTRKVKLLFPEHHLSHAASAFYSSPYAESAILTIDGVGEWATASIGYGKDNSITILKELRFPHSVGLLYSAFTYFLGFKVNSGEYKLMGLAPYGISDSEETTSFIRIIKDKLIDIKEDGSIHLNQEYFNYATGLRMVFDNKWEKLFGFKKRNEEDELQQQHCNLAFAIQKVTDEIVLKMAGEAKRLTGSNNICMAGGVALNCVANGHLLRSGVFQNVFVQPASGDAGGAVGAAQAAYHIYFNKERTQSNTFDGMHGSYLGPEFSDLDIELGLKKFGAVYEKHERFDTVAEKTASLINQGNVVGWMQGRMEFGPRALGNRSILGDARNSEMQKKLNLKIKYREGFRPFAPSVKAEDAAVYFDLNASSPYMLLVAPVKESRRTKLPDNYASLPLMERLYYLRSDIPAVTHVDFSARVQTIHKETNPRYYLLLEKFKALTGCSVLVNTSFNVRGEPPVCTPEDAYKCFMRTEMDYLVIGNYLLAKAAQPAWKEKGDWKKEFTLD
ncbi:MAG: carbamoyltransferase [Chitinophagales bacterium]|nr:carbamoyltransferase [Chitinophagales bacterium]